MRSYVMHPLMFHGFILWVWLKFLNLCFNVMVFEDFARCVVDFSWTESLCKPTRTTSPGSFWEHHIGCSFNGPSSARVVACIHSLFPSSKPQNMMNYAYMAKIRLTRLYKRWTVYYESNPDPNRSIYSATRRLNRLISACFSSLSRFLRSQIILSSLIIFGDPWMKFALK